MVEEDASIPPNKLLFLFRDVKSKNKVVRGGGIHSGKKGVCERHLCPSSSLLLTDLSGALNQNSESESHLPS